MRRLTAAVVALLIGAAHVAVAASEHHGLYVAPNAVDLATGKSKQSVLYYVREAYPATETLAFIQDSLAKTGWCPATCAERSRYETSSLESGWQERPMDESAAMLVWSARWVDARGNQVAYTLVYASRLHGLQTTHAAVSGMYEDRKLAARMRAESDERFERRARRYQLRTPKPCRSRTALANDQMRLTAPRKR